MKKNSGKAAGAAPQDVDGYLAALPREDRLALEALRRAIRAAAPEAEEVISYRIPTYRYHGPLVHFLAREDYCSFITASRAVLEAFRDDLEDYRTSGTTIHFTAGKPLPGALVQKIVRARIAENRSRAKS